VNSAGRGRLKLAALGALFLLPVALAWLAYVTGWTPGTRANYGELVAPQLLAVAPFEGLRGKWVLVQFDAAACDAGCEGKLYLMRQVRRAQGENQRRVERLWIVTDAARPAPRLLEAIEGTRVVPLADAALPARFPGNAAAHVYLVDPLGNLMMRFPRDPDPARVIRDLERLLRYSGSG